MTNIKPTDRIIMAKQEIRPLRFPVEQENFPSMKPNGLWYAIGTEWIEWVQSEMPHWMGNIFYKIEINKPKMLMIDKEYKLIEFTEEYQVVGKWPSGRTRERGEVIDWKRVTEKYSGIEIAPYQWNMRREYMWYYGWDVASGCIWKEDAITKILKVKVKM